MKTSHRGKRTIAVLLIPLASIAGQAASAEGSDKELLDTLLGNKTISREQYEQLLEPEEAGDKPATAVVETKPAPATSSPLGGVKVSVGNKGLVVTSEDDSFWLGISGRLHFEASAHAGDGGLPDGKEATDGTEIRRARFAISGKLYDDFKWTGEVDFADNATTIKDFWLGYNGLPQTKLYIGQVKQPYSLDVEMSTNDIAFIERGIDTFLIQPFIDRALGLRGEFSGDNWFIATGLFGESVDPNKDDDEGWGTAGRVVVAPILTDDTVLHLGVRGAYRQPSTNGNSLRVKDETTHLSNLNVVDTGNIADVEDVVLVGGEAALAYGPAAVKAEYNEAYFNRRRSNADLDFDSWRVEALLMLTGETRADSYKMSAGEFKRVVPKENFSISECGSGAWELATRLSSLDLNDGAIAGGEEMVFTSALNWYLNPVVRLMFEWSRIVDTDNSSALRKQADGIDIFQFRTQLAF